MAVILENTSRPRRMLVYELRGIPTDNKTLRHRSENVFQTTHNRKTGEIRMKRVRVTHAPSLRLAYGVSSKDLPVEVLRDPNIKRDIVSGDLSVVKRPGS